MCLDCYDYVGAVLFNAVAGELWRRLTIYLRRDLASAIGESRAGFDRQAKVAFMKVAEYQARGVIHYHAVIRLDGPEGPSTAPPDWASVDLLDSCLRRAVRAVHVEVPDPGQATDDLRSTRFGRQIDVQAVSEAVGPEETAVTSRHVALYLSKYVTKGAEACGTVDHRIKPSDLDLLHLPPHAERMIRTCFKLADTGTYNDLLLSKWAHMLGYRGHVATKSRAYSTTYSQLRGERKAHQENERRRQAGLPPLDDRPVIIDAEWRFIRAGLSYGEKWLVDAICRSQLRSASVDRASSS